MLLEQEQMRQCVKTGHSEIVSNAPRESLFEKRLLRQVPDYPFGIDSQTHCQKRSYVQVPALPDGLIVASQIHHALDSLTCDPHNAFLPLSASPPPHQRIH